MVHSAHVETIKYKITLITIKNNNNTGSNILVVV